MLRNVRPSLDALPEDGDRLRRLLESVLIVGSGLELDSTLQRIVQSATTLLDCRYGALGVRSPDGGLSEFVYEGIDPEQRSIMGHLPEGRGILGLLIRHPHPKPLRLENLGDHPASIGFPPNHPPMHSFLGMPIMMREHVFGSIYLTEKHGGRTFTEVDESMLAVLANAAGLAIENARLFEESRDRERWLTSTSAVTGRLLTGGPLRETLDALVRQVRMLAAADDVFILVPHGDETELVASAHDDAPPDEACLPPWTAPPFVEVTRTRASLTLPDPSVLAGLAPRAARAAVLPLTTTAGVAGALVVTSRDSGAWDAATLDRLESAADLAAVALEFAEQQRAQRLLSVLADRDRIARDLHDNVIQRLFATGMSLQSTTSVDDVPERVAEVVAGAIEQLDRTVREIRTTIFDLQTSSEVSATSLRRRLLDVIGDLTGLSPFAPNVRFSGAIDTLVHPRVHGHAEAVLRESLSNALRHAQATSIDITATADTESFTVTVSDDGIGMGDTTRRSGLDNVERRAEQCGGHVVIESTPTGTVITWTVPL
ncbi:GAF domain-containing protein [Rhodococcus rhodnii]|nr:GAF domain-containing protein [Rhodococcus rhodnii]TXG92961.1 GAF domain-containing protein [Rhodococcus rhodnii]